MRCPFCNADKDSLKVIDSRSSDGGRGIRRRRECMHCSKRFTTYERIEENTRLIVIKRDGRRVPWDRAKIVAGLERACFKRAVPEEVLRRIVDEVEDEVFRTYDREVPSQVVGERVADRLRRTDQVAYVRFASVYKQFATVEQLMEEAQRVADLRRFEVPGQGRLFVDPSRSAAADPDAAPANGEPAPDAPRKPRPRKKSAEIDPENSTSPPQT